MSVLEFLGGDIEILIISESHHYVIIQNTIDIRYSLICCLLSSLLLKFFLFCIDKSASKEVK